VSRPHFTATRALSIEALPEQVWPWLMQVGCGRAGFYSYDFLDNLGRPSADVILPDWQASGVGSVTAPMANPPTVATSFVVAELDPGRSVVWSKPDSTWTWLRTPLPEGRTRLVTRSKQRYRLGLGLPVTVILAEFGDFPMMRKMLLGIKRRAVRAADVVAFGGAWEGPLSAGVSIAACPDAAQNPEGASHGVPRPGCSASRGCAHTASCRVSDPRWVHAPSSPCTERRRTRGPP